MANLLISAVIVEWFSCAQQYLHCKISLLYWLLLHIGLLWLLRSMPSILVVELIGNWWRWCRW